MTSNQCLKISNSPMKFILKLFLTCQCLWLTTIIESHKNLDTMKNSSTINNQYKLRITVSPKKIPNQDPMNTPTSNYLDLSCIEDKPKLEQMEMNMNVSDTIFISIAWIVLPSFQLFVLCP